MYPEVAILNTSFQKFFRKGAGSGPAVENGPVLPQKYTGPDPCRSTAHNLYGEASAVLVAGCKQNANLREQALTSTFVAGRRLTPG